MMGTMNDTAGTLLATIRQLAAELHTRPEAAIRLRNTTRAKISRRCGEPDLAPGATEEMVTNEPS